MNCPTGQPLAEFLENPADEAERTVDDGIRAIFVNNRAVGAIRQTAGAAVPGLARFLATQMLTDANSDDYG